MKRSAVVWTNSICACSEPMLLTRWTAVRQGRFAGKPFLAMRPKSSSMASPRIRWRQRAKGMVNAAYLAGKLLAALPRERCAPETTDGRDGFIRPIHVEGRTERTVVKFLLRDFELKGLADKGKILRGLCRGLQASEPRARVRSKLRKQYRNIA